MSQLPHVVILGGGPAGLGAAYRLHRLGRGRATVLERGERFGGNAGSFRLSGHHLDYGSHRLHPATDPAILDDIQRMLGSDLRERPRHGRIRLRGRWVHFPLKPFDLLMHVHPGFLAGAARDAAARAFGRGTPATEQQRSGGEPDSFADVLLARLGPTICRDFYFPYARKIWGLEPDELAAEQAERRVSANSPGKLARKVLAQVPGFRASGSGRFYYPREGFGQISEAYANAARDAGAELLTGTSARELSAPAAPGGVWTIHGDQGKRPVTLTADYVWSSIPLTLLARMTRPSPPPAVLEAASTLQYRAMLLVYLELPVDRFTEYDAHYFPGEDVAITRLSEPKNYSATAEPAGRTVLCAELPSSPAETRWSASDDELAALVAADLERAGLPLPQAPVSIHVRRLSHAYPIYTRGYAPSFAELDRWAAGLPGLLTFGRQGLFAHDNTHHALAMAYAAVDCLGADGFDHGRWAGYRAEFAKHVVVD